ncbi:MAG: Gfo/Idh/MocA family oxidoreductase [Chloroflexota bacterium]|nr:Gfo/Idh/MocA family oxidoreductase [Chloroflexota bacterium]
MGNITDPRIAIIGAGFITRVGHLPGYKAAVANVVAICDVNEEPARKLAAQYGIPRVYADWREMITAEAPDIVSVCLPNVLHREPTLFALDAGAHVLCEKPLATSVAEAAEMFAAAESAGRTLMAAQNWRWDGGSRAIKRIVDTGDLGDIYYAEATAMRRTGIPTWGVFHQKALSHGGALLDVGVHMLDLAIWLMGNPQPVRVSAQTQRKFGTRPDVAKMLRHAWDPAKFDVEDFAVALVYFASGATLLLRTSWAAHIDAEVFSVRLAGTEGGATTTPPVVYRNHAGIPADEHLQLQKASSYEREIAHWLRVVAGQEAPLVTRAETMNVQRIIDAAYESAAAARDVEILA